ncbi:histidine decarboxylase [Candidatus Woesebacteria bacterium]|nr:histidine decarboxylase [Candidatus Woesebacteria bacterium]
MTKKISKLLETVAENSAFHLGYPLNLDLPLDEILPLFKYHLNNAGDPFEPLTLKLNTKDIEIDVINFFAKLYSATPDQVWGYVTTGGTEGNLYGLFLARESFPDGVLYYSKETHYSVSKVARLLRLPARMIDSLDNGEIDYEKFECEIQKNLDKPVLICANMGTTMKGAIDSVARLKTILHDNAVKQYYIHVDAALSGMIAPFVTELPDHKITELLGGGINSIAISGHKFVGSPIPCGIVLTHQKTKEPLHETIEYLHSIDSTILGSRSGHTPLIMWHAIERKKKAGFTRDAKRCIKLAQYLQAQLTSQKVEAHLNPWANTVYFAKPAESICEKWQLATQGPYVHAIIMPNIDKPKLDLFLADLKASREN